MYTLCRYKPKKEIDLQLCVYKCAACTYAVSMRVCVCVCVCSFDRMILFHCMHERRLMYMHGHKCMH